MILFQEFFGTAMSALIFCCIIAKLLSFSVSNDGKIATDKSVVEEANITKGLIVESRKSKKKVKFVEKEVVRNVDRFEIEKPDKDGVELMLSKVEGLVDQSCSEEVLLEKQKNENILDKGDDFKGEKIPETLGAIEQCGVESDESKKTNDGENVLESSLMNDKVNLGQNEGLGKEDWVKGNQDSDDDWEGIERSELEVEFAKAINFVEEGKGKENLGSDHELMMQLYGLQKIAMEGPCHEPQPMALKVSARAKWNAWQRMGSMNPELAMEQYIKILSDHVPGGMHDSKDDHREVGSVPDSFNDICKDERVQEMNRAAEGGDFSGDDKEKE